MADETRVRCGFFLKRKNRYCKMIPGKGEKYCGEHSYLCEENEKCSDRKRIPCPLDTNHTVFEDQLEKHLKKCNVTKKRQVGYYQANINSGLTKISEEESNITKLSLKMIPKSDIQACIDMIKSYFTDNMVEISTSISTDKNLEEEIGKIGTNPTLRKHLHQQSSLIGNMRESGLLTPNNVFIEFGAGRGLLSHWVQRSIRGESNVEFLLVDRASTRYKADSYHRGTDQGPSFHRIQIDIEHLDLKKVPLISKSTHGITGISKHLCGAATDLALRCLLCSSCDNQMSNDGDEDGAPKDNTSCNNSAKRIKLDNTHIKGLLFALCCHHCCSWTSYVGKEILEKLGFTPYYFHILCCLTSWATCGSRNVRLVSDTEDQTQTKKLINKTESHSETCELQQEDKEVEESTIRALGFSKSESEEIGRQSKHLLDAGRVEYLKAHGFKSSLIYYVERTVSLENVALIAWNR